MNKRQFLKTLGLSAISSPIYSETFSDLIKSKKGISAQTLAKDEAFWSQIRKEYKLNPDFINLENGYYCITPTPIKNAFIKNVEEVNLLGSHYMRKRRFPDNEIVREKLAKVAGCTTEEIVITRNTTESIDTIISGYNWQPGDEAVMASTDYGSMLDHFDLMAKRYGLVRKTITLPLTPRK